MSKSNPMYLGMAGRILALITSKICPRSRAYPSVRGCIFYHIKDCELNEKIAHLAIFGIFIFTL